MSVVLVALALVVTGLSGAYSYWESYYQHRGFATVALAAGARRGHTVTVHFWSAALGREADYIAYLPPGYDPVGHRYPVYYLLHGIPGRPVVFLGIGDMGLRMDNLLAEHRMRPMILVYPDGRIGGSTYSDSEWANTRSGNFESYVLDVVNDVDHRFATIPDRRDRVIAGFSAGGYGATNITLHHLGVFGNLQSWSGYYLETRSGVFANATRSRLAYNSPLDYVRKLGPQLAAHPLRAFLFVGRDDDVSPQTIPMAKALAARGATVSYALYRGGHDWQLWHAHLYQMLVLASRDVSRPLGHGSGKARTLTPGVVATPKHHHHHKRRPFGLPRLPGPLLRASTPGPPAPGTLVRASTPGPTPPAPLVMGELSAAIVPAAHGLGLSELLGGLMLALGSAVLINIGFLLQHRGLGERVPGGLAATLRRAVRSPSWLSGQALGWLGFGAQIVAVAIAPLSLVQAFAAGGLALSVPLAAGFFSHRITRSQVLAVLLIAVSLAALPIGFSTARDHLHAGALGACAAVAVLAALAVAAIRTAPMRAIAAGAFYGVADAAIKAVSIRWHAQGGAALLSLWTLVAALATFGGFLAFQSALREDSAISSISLMNALAALVALACGLIAFGESLGAKPVTVVVHLAAIAVVLGCVPVLAAAQTEMAQAAGHADGRNAPNPTPLQPGYESPG